MMLPCLLLQKPSQNSKAKDHSKALEDRLKWMKENHNRNSTNTKHTQDASAHSFTKLMWEDKTGSP